MELSRSAHESVAIGMKQRGCWNVNIDILPPSACSLQAPLPRSYLAHPPSKTVPAATSMTLLFVLVDVAVGTPPVYALHASAAGTRAARLASLAR